MKRDRTFLALTAFLVVGVIASAASADVVLREQYPTQGESTDLFIQGDDGAPVAGATVSVTYRPGSSVEVTDTVGTTGPSGRLAWTPQTAGVVTVNAAWDGGSTSTNVSVRFGRAPVAGIIIMILAGLLLVGGSIVRVLRVARAG